MKNLNRIAAVLLAGSILGGGAMAFAQTTAPAPDAAASAAVTAPDVFAQTAAASDAFEIASSELALKRSESAEVKAFAQQMITDHTKSSANLKAAAATDGVSVTPTLDAKHQDQLNMLQGTPASGFDAKYIAAQTAAHIEAVSLFDAYATGGKPGAVKDFAAKTLPTLKMHLDHVKGLSARAPA